MCGCCLDLITLRAAYCLSRSVKAQSLTENTLSTQTSTPSQVSTNNQINNNNNKDSYHQNNYNSNNNNNNSCNNYNTLTPPHIPNTNYPKLGTSDEKCAQLIRGIAIKMAKLNIDQTDVAMMAAILLMSPGCNSLDTRLTCYSSSKSFVYIDELQMYLAELDDQTTRLTDRTQIAPIISIGHMTNGCIHSRLTRGYL
ncbi:unnamed protein product [Trichobilharzia regenti]|nr:unnamed protein product [Trichobilharzia regenti]